MILSVVSNVMLPFPFGDAIGMTNISRKETLKTITFIFLLFLFVFCYYTFFQKKERTIRNMMTCLVFFNPCNSCYGLITITFQKTH